MSDKTTDAAHDTPVQAGPGVTLGVLPRMLTGLRVLDLSRNLPGPFATQMLADLGAHVIKVEPPEGDPARALSPLFKAINHHKELRQIDFREEVDLNRLRGWLTDADVMIDSFRPGVLGKLGLDSSVLHALNPKLTMISLTGYGQIGPWASKAGHDINFMAMSGALDQMRAPTGELAQANVQWGDLAGGSSMACIAVLSGVFEVRTTGKGRHVDVSMTHGLYAHLVMPRATGTLMAKALGRAPGAGEDLLNGVLPCYGLYVTQDGRYLAVGALEFKFWKAACDVWARPDWMSRHWQRDQIPGSSDCKALRTELEGLIASQPLAAWAERFATADACITPVLTLEEACRHPLFADGARHQPWTLVSS